MTPRTFNISIRIRPDAQIKGLYTNRTYIAATELDNALEVMATLEGNKYVFRQHKSNYSVSTDGCDRLIEEPILDEWHELAWLGLTDEWDDWEEDDQQVEALMEEAEYIAMSDRAEYMSDRF